MSSQVPSVVTAVIASFLFCSDAHANSLKERYEATARGSSGATTYLEKHDVTFSSQGKPLTAKADYLRPDGTKIGVIKSNFEKDLSAPEYSFQDLRDGSSHGLEVRDDAFVLWRKDKDEPRREVSYPKNKFSTDALVVGCQGLHYCLIDNLDAVKKRGSIPIKYLIPGKLDYYSFTLKFDREDENYIHLKLRIDSIILRLLTSSISLKYSKPDRRLISYSGLSNIPDDRGDTQVVTIDYVYKNKKDVATP